MGVVYSGGKPACCVLYLKSGDISAREYRLTRLFIRVFSDYIQLDWIPHYKAEEKTLYLSYASHELKVAAACLAAGLMPPSVFADLLEDHRPDLVEAAAFLREWERVHKEQQK